MVRNANTVSLLERLLAIAGGIICWVVCIRTWQVVLLDYSPGGQAVWPLPGLYLLEMMVLSLVGTFAAFHDRAELRRDWGSVTWAVAGIFLAFAVMGAWSIGLFFLPTALLFVVVAILADARQKRNALAHVVVYMIAGLAQAALMLMAIQVFYPTARAQTPAPPPMAIATPPATATLNPVTVIPSRTPWITTIARPTTIPVPRTSTPVPLGPAPIRVHPPGAHTGIAEVDSIVTTVLAGDVDAIRKLVHYTIAGCVKSPGLGGPPKCESGEADGTRVEVFPILGSEGGFGGPSSIDTVVRFKAKGLYGIYRVSANAYKADYWPAGEYGIVLIRDDETALTVLVENGEIVRIVYHMQPLEMALNQDVGEWLLSPPTASSSSKALPTRSDTNIRPLHDAAC